jgi:L-seryl-tRNA(Ser) seleniumtransferase
MSKPDFSKIPKVDTVLDDPAMSRVRALCDGPWATEWVRDAINALRGVLKQGDQVGQSREALTAWVIQKVEERLAQELAPRLRRVVNATGIILHTNLGRAPLPEEAIAQIVATAGRYSNVEIDLETGLRGSRTSLVERLLCQLTGAEAAAVVNNNAAAVLLALNTLARGKEAIVSRGELVEIGGSFRIPDIMERSGATMVEVGTTNRTHLKDFQSAVTPRTGAMLIVHTSNYKVMGFTAAVDLGDLVALGREEAIPTIHDLGGGVLIDLRDYGLPYEPLVSDSVKAGVDVVTFSGDKILGGPQCGILVGKKAAIALIRQNPLMRALRCDKLTYAALDATLKLYLSPGRLRHAHPTLRMLTEPVSALRQRGEALLSRLENIPGLEVALVDAIAQTGSGALPLEEIPSVAIAISCEGINRLAGRLRKYTPPVVGYVRDDRLLLDLRTLWEDDLEVISEALTWAVS